MRLAVVSCCFNPCGYAHTRENCMRFVEALGPHADRLWLTALDFERDDSEKLILPRQVWAGCWPTDHRNILWQKEALLNAAIKAVPKEFDAIAWLDADITFADPGWLEHAERALEDSPVVQLFDRCLYLGPMGQVERTRASITSQRRRTGEHAWGLAWAARREVLADGLLDWVVTGGADAMMGDAWLGWSSKRKMTYEMERLYRPWAAKQVKLTAGRVSCLHQTISHFYHGDLKHRKYGWRTRLLIDRGFDPKLDIERDGAIYRWTDHNPGLRKEVEAWLLGNPYERKIA